MRKNFNQYFHRNQAGEKQIIAFVINDNLVADD